VHTKVSELCKSLPVRSELLEDAPTNHLEGIAPPLESHDDGDVLAIEQVMD
jgi:hypothetical protein